MPQGDSPPSLELAPGFKAPVPTDYGSMKEYIETALPAESPIMYGMHTNAELSLLTSQVNCSLGSGFQHEQNDATITHVQTSVCSYADSADLAVCGKMYMSAFLLASGTSA